MTLPLHRLVFRTAALLVGFACALPGALFVTLPMASPLAAGSAEGVRFIEDLRRQAVQWRGVGVQLGDVSWGMELDLSGDVPRVRYPDLGCEGHWQVLGRKAGGPLVVIEQIDKGREECIDGGVALVEPIETGGLLRYHWLDGDGETVAGAVLVPGRFDPALADALLDLTMENIDQGFLSLAETRGLVPYRTP